MRPLYFIASYPRSGNTWARAFIFALLKETGKLPAAFPFKDLDEILPWDIRARYVQPVLGKPPHESSLEDMARARPLVHKLFAERFKVPPIVKTHAIFGRIGRYETIDSATFGGATYLVRNPLDVAPSVARLLGCSIGDAIEIMARRAHVTAPHEGAAAEPWGDWSFNVHSWTEVGPARVLVLKYEDLRSSPEQQFAKLSRHLGLQGTAEQLRAAVKFVELQELEKLEASKGFTSLATNAKTFFGTGARLDYRDKLTQEEARSLVLSHAVRMEKFGYLDAATLAYAGLDRPAALAASRTFLA